MKTLFFECSMGAAGDMLMAALLELHPNADQFLSQLNNIGLPSVVVQREKRISSGISGTHIHVIIDNQMEVVSDFSVQNCDIHSQHCNEHEHHYHNKHEHHHHDENEHHRHMNIASIQKIISELNISESVKNDVISVYQIIAEAESHAHDLPVDQIHFHEVGNLDAIADIVGVCLLIKEISPDHIISTPIHVGSGHVKCAHGILPVPAPATAYILQGVPCYQGEIKGELCTPTGAALLKYFCDGFGAMPSMISEKIGYGMGSKTFSIANCVRVFLGESFSDAKDSDEVVELACNLDDMSGEDIAFASNLFMEEGALDVYTAPIQMKKNRPGHILVCLCQASDEKKFVNLLFAHTSTFGLRRKNISRYILNRKFSQIDTEIGQIAIKQGFGYGVTKMKPEYADLVKLSAATGLSLRQTRIIAQHAWDKQQNSESGI